MRRALVGLVVLVSTFAALPAFAPDVVAAPLPYQTSGTGLHGGGFLNVVAVDPFDPSVVLVGGDNSGVSRSADGGQTWQPANNGQFGHRQRRIAAIAFSPSDPGKVFMGVGDKGIDSGLYVSDDHGLTWKLRSATPRFSGANNSGVADLPAPHPRSTGNLVAFDESRGLLYVATFDGGLLRSQDDGFTWVSLGLEGSYLRSLAQDPQDPTVLYAGTFGEGAYRIVDAAGAAVVEHLPSAPTTVEEFAAASTQLFAATSEGVQVSGDRGDTWTDLSAGLPATEGRDTAWMSIETIEDPTGLVVIAGAFRPPSAATGYASLVRSTDGGANWEPLGVQPGSVEESIGGSGGDPWWYASASPNNLFGGPWYAAAQVVASPHDPATIFSAGRGGLWKSGDGGDSWYPAVEGLSVAENTAVGTDTNDPNRVVVGNTDWVILHSQDAMTHVAQSLPPGGNEAYDVAFAADRLYAAVGHRDFTDQDGEIYSTADVTDATAWVDEGLSDNTSGLRPIAVAAFDDPVDGRVVLAAVTESGVWRKHLGEWTLLDTPAVSGKQATHRAVFQVVADTRLVYLFDRGRGVWRSTDAGVSWERVWGVTSQAVTTGDFVVDPLDPNRLYVGTVGGLWRLDGAGSGSVEDGSVGLTDLGVASPGPVAAAADGLVYVATRPIDGPAQLLVTGDGGASFVDVADERYRGAAAFPVAMTVASNGDIHLATIGNGNIVVRGEPPVTTTELAGLAGEDGWHRGSVTVTLNAEDAGGGSAVRELTYSASGAEVIPATTVPGHTATLQITADGETKVEYFATDMAGRIEAVQSLTVRVDSIGPVVSCDPTPGGWSADDVVVACSASDGTSQLADIADAAFDLTTSVGEGVEDSDAMTNSRSIRDMAGNTTDIGPLGPIAVDKHAPDVDISSPSDGASFVEHSVIMSGFTCLDAGAGVASCAGDVETGTAIDTSPGVHIFHVDAVDAVGNATTSTSTYTVVQDTTPPETLVDVPAPEQRFESGLIRLVGTATDDAAIDGVTIAIRDRDTGLWWHANGTWDGWQTHAAVVASSGAVTDWEFDWVGAESGSYALWARANDVTGNTDPSPAWVRFGVDGEDPDHVAPDTAVTIPAPLDALTPPIVIRGTAVDDRSLGEVHVAVRDRDTGLWWHADGGWGTWQTHVATKATTGSATDWEFALDDAGPGSFAVWARAIDSAGNADPTPVWIQFEISSGHET